MLSTVAQVAGYAAANAPKIAQIASGVMQVNDAISDAQKALSAQNNQNVTDTRSGGEASASQGYKVAPIYF